jgi:cytochrome c oxidase subunit 2
MKFRTFTVSPADFESWAKHQAEAAAGTPAPAAPAAPAPGATAAPAAPPPATAPAAATATAPATTAAPVVQAGFVSFPREQLPANTVPQTPLPAGLNFDDSLLGKGDVANGAKLLISTGGCLACHAIKGNPMMQGNIGPNLTHIATRTTIGAGLFPNDPRYLARWIKNAREMKPGVIMNTIGIGEFDPVLKQTMKAGLSDQQIADIVAYLQTLK